MEGPSGCTTEAGGYDQDWGDYDQDGDLDLALATADQTVVYRNDNGQLVTAGNHAHRTFSVRWADVDNDGKLELISAGDFEITNGFRRGKNYIYDDNVFYVPNQTFITPDVLWRIDLADYDRDGALDLAAASYIDTAYRTQHNMCLLRLYKNTGGAFSPNECLIGPLTKESVWTPSESRHSYAVAWADTDQDSDLDLSVGDYGTPNRLHQNTGLQLGAASSQLGDNNSNADNTTSLAWADFDDDNYPDAAWGNQNQPARLYRNNRQALPNTTWNLAWSGPTNDTRSVAWGNFPTIPNRDASIALDDDVALEYTLPFAFSFGRTTPRSIKRISINTNGMIELLEAGEVCRACGSWQNLHRYQCPSPARY
ncbi:MAG: VCBS repeat-containing protein [Anaerolineales bacterium]|nr:VCBS repeat-containing protein [Anaerolineales bacterium]